MKCVNEMCVRARARACLCLCVCLSVSVCVWVCVVQGMHVCVCRRPSSFKEVFEHRLFNAGGELRFLESTEEPWEDFVCRQAADLHAAIASSDSDNVQELFNRGGVHIDMVASGSTHGSAFTNADIGKTVSIKGDDVKIDDVSRSIAWGDAKHHDCTGTIKSVEEKPKGKVQLTDKQEFENGAHYNVGDIVWHPMRCAMSSYAPYLCTGLSIYMQHHVCHAGRVA